MDYIIINSDLYQADYNMIKDIEDAEYLCIGACNEFTLNELNKAIKKVTDKNKPIKKNISMVSYEYDLNEKIKAAEMLTNDLDIDDLPF